MPDFQDSRSRGDLTRLNCPSLPLVAPGAVEALPAPAPVGGHRAHAAVLAPHRASSVLQCSSVMINEELSTGLFKALIDVALSWQSAKSVVLASFTWQKDPLKPCGQEHLLCPTQKPPLKQLGWHESGRRDGAAICVSVQFPASKSRGERYPISELTFFAEGSESTGRAVTLEGGDADSSVLAAGMAKR